jgi:hypothetical protein
MDTALKDFIAAVVGYMTQRGWYVTRTKLLKVLYLFDVEYFRHHRKIFTGFTWKFFHLGPWTAEYSPLVQTLVDCGFLEETTSNTQEYDARFLRSRLATDFDKLLGNYKDGFTVRSVLDTWGPRTTGEILDHVYFHTEPMNEAIRHEKLDFQKIPEAEPLFYKRSSSGASPKDIEKRRGEFKKRVAPRRTAFHQFTPPKYDEDFEHAIAKLDQLAG